MFVVIFIKQQTSGLTSVALLKTGLSDVSFRKKSKLNSRAAGSGAKNILVTLTILWNVA